MHLVKQAAAGMAVSGGIRFLPIYGQSGSGKTSAAQELSTHLPECEVFTLTREAIESQESLNAAVHAQWKRRLPPKLLIAVVDQYEENVARRTDVPTRFVEALSLLDRGELRTNPTLFLWLTTSKEFQGDLAEATSRNERILVARSFEIAGPVQAAWPQIIEETFEFHNHGQMLADFDVLRDDLDEISYASGTIGQAIEEVGRRLGPHASRLQDISDYQVVMAWPVTGSRIDRILAFTLPGDGYKLDWNAFYRAHDQNAHVSLPFHALNRARLYFDVRLVPIAVADLHALSHDLENIGAPLAPSYLERFKKSHLYSVVEGSYDPAAASRLRARESKRADDAATWYETVTDQPVLLGRRMARIFSNVGLPAKHEASVTAKNHTARTDILVQRVGGGSPAKVLLELKAFSTKNTMPAAIRDAVRGTLRKYAQLGGP